jgi:hypothetical protein
MRQIARYVFSSEQNDASSTAARFERARDIVDTWVGQKGWNGGADFGMPDGRAGNLTRESASFGDECTERWTLLEEIAGGFFETMVGLARSADRVHVSATLAAGHNTNQLAPLQYEARCPTVVRQLAEQPWGWRLGASPIAVAPHVFRGSTGGDTLSSLLLHKERTLPVVTISTHFGLTIHREIAGRMARDLVGLATVAVMDDDAAWTVTQKLGKHLSCFNGAIRLYWPGLTLESQPLRHPLWTAARLMTGPGTVDAAEKFIRDTLRKRLMAVSVPALAEAAVFENVRRGSEEQEEARRRSQLTESADYQRWAEQEAERADRLKAQVASLEGQLKELRQQLYRLQSERAWSDEDDSLLPDDSQPPETVEEAVARARVLFAGRLRFGDDVDTGVRGLSRTAGPPDKVFRYLSGLAEMAAARQAGPLGKSPLQWLSASGIDGSEESETVSKNKTEQRKRTWDDGANQQRVFDLHLKPNEATQPDQCVRIYFDWDDAAAQVVVGWVGRHP